MIFYTTDIGIQAAIDFGTGGPAVNLTHFRVGADYGYALPAPVLPSNTPNGTSTTSISPPGLGLAGELPIIGYREVAPDTVEYTLRMDANIGTFDFGNIGIYMSTGQLFAIAVLDAPVRKEIFGPGTAGNVVEFVVRLVFGGATVTIDYVINPVVNANLLEVSSVDLLTTPTLADSNAYSVKGSLVNPIGLTDNSNAFIAYSKDNTFWNFTEYSKVMYTGTVTTSTITSLSDSSLPALPWVAGRYLVQFTSGAHAGIVRAVTASPAGSLTWHTSTGSPVAAGTSYVVLCSDYFARSLETYPEVNDLALLPVAEATASRTYRLTRNEGLASSGVNSYLVSAAKLNYDSKAYQNNEWIPTSHSLVWSANALKVQSASGGGFTSDTTHVVVALPVTTPLASASIPSPYNSLVISFFESGDSNQGLIRNVTNVSSNVSGGTEYVEFTLSQPIPNTPGVGARFKLWSPSGIGGGGSGGGGSGTGQNDFHEGTATDSGDGFQYIIGTGTVSAASCLMFASPGYIPESLYTVTGTNQITLSAGNGLPVGTKYQFVERTIYGIPGGNSNQVLAKLSNADYDYGWVTLAQSTPMTQVILRYQGSSTTLRMFPVLGGQIVINGTAYPVPASVSLNISAMPINELRLVYAYWTGTNLALEISTTDYAIGPFNTIKAGDPTRTLVGLVIKTGATTGATRSYWWDNLNQYSGSTLLDRRPYNRSWLTAHQNCLVTGTNSDANLANGAAQVPNFAMLPVLLFKNEPFRVKTRMLFGYGTYSGGGYFGRMGVVDALQSNLLASWAYGDSAGAGDDRLPNVYVNESFTYDTGSSFSQAMLLRLHAFASSDPDSGNRSIMFATADYGYPFSPMSAGSTVGAGSYVTRSLNSNLMLDYYTQIQIEYIGFPNYSHNL